MRRPIRRSVQRGQGLLVRGGFLSLSCRRNRGDIDVFIEAFFTFGKRLVFGYSCCVGGASGTPEQEGGLYRK